MNISPIINCSNISSTLGLCLDFFFLHCWQYRTLSISVPVQIIFFRYTSLTNTTMFFYKTLFVLTKVNSSFQAKIFAWKKKQSKNWEKFGFNFSIQKEVKSIWYLTVFSRFQPDISRKPKDPFLYLFVFLLQLKNHGEQATWTDDRVKNDAKQTCRSKKILKTPESVCSSDNVLLI